MHELLDAVAFAAALTSITAFRWSPRPRTAAAYFVGFAVVEYIVHGVLLPEGTFPPETAYVLLFITALFLGALALKRRFAPADE